MCTLNVASIDILHCRFLNNNNENYVTNGSDIYFIFEMLNRPAVTVKNNEFIRSIKNTESKGDRARSIIYFKETHGVIFFFTDNSFILTDNFNEVANAAVFYSYQPGQDYTSWVLQSNCLLQSEYPLGEKNEYFTPPIKQNGILHLLINAQLIYQHLHKHLNKHQIQHLHKHLNKHQIQHLHKHQNQHLNKHQIQLVIFLITYFIMEIVI